MATYYDKQGNDLENSMNLRSWPHQFAPSGSEKVIGVDRDFMPDGEHAMKIVSKEMYCVHCKATYWTRKDGIPPPPCPARSKDKEMKRILG